MSLLHIYWRRPAVVLWSLSVSFNFSVSPLPFPHAFQDISTLKLILGVGLFLIGALVFSLWKDRLFALKEDERAKFLMFNLYGGGWLVAVFAVCGGIYFLFDSIFRFSNSI